MRTTPGRAIARLQPGNEKMLVRKARITKAGNISAISAGIIGEITNAILLANR